MRWIIILFIFSCKTPKQIITGCDQQIAIDVADRTIKRGGYKIETLKREVIEFKAVYLIHYRPIEKGC
jgi:hypothetical protein